MTSLVRGRERRGERLDDGVPAANRIGQLDGPERRVTLSGDGVRRERDRAIGELRDDDLIARIEGDGPEHGVGPRRDAGHEHQIVGTRAEKGGDGRRRLAQPRLAPPRRRLLAGELAQDEARRQPLDLITKGLLLPQHPRGRSADGAVIEIGELGIEKPLCEHRAAELGHGSDCTEWASDPADCRSAGLQACRVGQT